jgi:hypothetical protein
VEFAVGTPQVGTAPSFAVEGTLGVQAKALAD